MYNNTTTKLRE